MFNGLKANKIYKYLKEHYFQLKSMPNKIRNMLSDDKVLEIINSKLAYNRQIFKKSDLVIAELYRVDDVKITDYRNIFEYTRNIHYTPVGRRILQKLPNENGYGEDKYFVIREAIKFDNNKKELDNFHAKKIEGFASLLTLEGNSRDFFTREELIMMDKYLNGEIGKKENKLDEISEK